MNLKHTILIAFLCQFPLAAGVSIFAEKQEKQMKIEEKSVVTFRYILTSQSGEVIDQSPEEAPLSYIQGIGAIIPGLESEMEGKVTGDSFKVTIQPDMAYGERDDSLLQKLDKAQFQGVDTIEPGMQFQAQTESGVHILTVIGIEDDQVIVDGNHPLAGEILTFDVSIVEVRAATKEELEHGHIHGPNGHGH